jgi:Terpene cyclase DEP1
MTTADQADQVGQDSSMPTSRKVLCGVYGAIAVVALIATWSQTLAYSDKPAQSLLNFWNDSKVTPASRSLSADLLLLSLAAMILMVIEARTHGVKFVWLYLWADSPSRSASRFPCF